MQGPKRFKEHQKFLYKWRKKLLLRNSCITLNQIHPYPSKQPILQSLNKYTKTNEHELLSFIVLYVNLNTMNGCVDSDIKTGGRLLTIQSSWMGRSCSNYILFFLCQNLKRKQQIEWVKSPNKSICTWRGYCNLYS